MEAQAQPVLAEEDQQEVIYLVVDENPQGQQVTQIVSDGQLIGQHAQIIMQDGKQAVLITDGNQQQVVLLDDEVGPEQVQSALEHGAIQQNVLQQPSVSGMMSQTQVAATSTSTANSAQVQYLVTEGGEIISPITQVNQPVVTITSQPQQQQQQQQQHQLVVTQSGLVRIGGGSNKKDGGMVPGKSLINQAALKEAAAKAPRGKLEDQVLVMCSSPEPVKTQLSEQATLRDVISDAVDKQISGMVPTEQVQAEPMTDVAAPPADIQLPVTNANTEINSSSVPMDVKESKDETDTIGFNEDASAEVAEPVEPDSTQSGCTETVNGSLDKEMMSGVTAVSDNSMVSVGSDIPPLTVLPDQMMQDDEENRSVDETKNMQVPQVFNVPDQTMEIDASEIFSEKEPAEAKLTSDESTLDGADTAAQNAVIQPTSTLIIHEPEGKKKAQEELVPSTVITVISPQPKKKRRRYDMMRREEPALDSPLENSAKVTKSASDSIASRRERRTSKPTQYYGLDDDYEVYATNIFRTHRRKSESGDEASISRAKREQRKNIEDNFGFDIPSTDDEQPALDRKHINAKPGKTDITQTLLLPGEKQERPEITTPDQAPSVTGEPSLTGASTEIVDGTKEVMPPQPVKRGRGRPPKHPRKSLTKVKPLPKKLQASVQLDTSASKEVASEDKAGQPAETAMSKQPDVENLVADDLVAGEVPSQIENGLNSLDPVLNSDEDKNLLTVESGAKDEKEATGESEEGLKQPILVNNEMEERGPMMTLDSADEGGDTTASIQEMTSLETAKEDIAEEPLVEEVKKPAGDDDLTSETGVSEEKEEAAQFVKPTKKGTPGKPRGRPRKNRESVGQVGRQNLQDEGDSPRRSGRAKEKPCYAESSGEESQEAAEAQKEEIITPEQLREESNKVYSLQKEVTDLKFINDSLELRLAQQSGSPEEIRSLQARVDSLQMRNNELEAKLKNYEKSQKIGINIKGMKFSIKKDSTSPIKSKPTDVVRLREIELTEQELKTKEAQLEKRELKAKALDRELDERGAQLTKRESKLDRWERKLKSQEKEIEYKEKRLKRLENDLRDLGGTGGRHKRFDYVEDTELVIQQKDLQLWEEELRQREAEMLEKEKLLAATEKQLMALNTELNEKAEYLQAKEHSHSSGDEEGSLTDISLNNGDGMKSLPFKAWHSEGSRGKKVKGRRQNSSSTSLLTAPWMTSAALSDEADSSCRMPARSKGSGKGTPKTPASARSSSAGKRKSLADSQMTTPALAKRQKVMLKTSGKKKNLKSPASKAQKETPKSRKSDGQVQKKKLSSEMKSPRASKAKRK